MKMFQNIHLIQFSRNINFIINLLIIFNKQVYGQLFKFNTMLPKAHNIFNNDHSSQACSCSSTLLRRLQQNLEDMSDELQKSETKNSQLSKLIMILTDERNYYQEQLRKVQNQKRIIEEHFTKIKTQIESKSLLINELKKANRNLDQEVRLLNENLEESRFLFEAQEQQIERIKKQKQLIQKQWNKIIKEVNGKMNRIQKQQEEEEKENLQITSNLPLKEKVKKALRKIDKQIEENEAHNQNRRAKKPSFSTMSNQFFDQE